MWKITILRHKIIFFPILGGCAPGAPPPPESSPVIDTTPRVARVTVTLNLVIKTWWKITCYNAGSLSNRVQFLTFMIYHFLALAEIQHFAVSWVKFRSLQNTTLIIINSFLKLTSWKCWSFLFAEYKLCFGDVSAFIWIPTVHLLFPYLFINTKQTSCRGFSGKTKEEPGRLISRSGVSRWCPFTE